MEKILSYVLWVIKKFFGMIGKIFEWSANDPAADARRNTQAFKGASYGSVSNVHAMAAAPKKMKGTDIDKLSNTSKSGTDYKQV